MEPVGLAVGVVGLAGIFTTCLDVIERFDAWKDFGQDSRAFAARFNASKLLFKKWGDAAGFANGRLSDDHHKALDDPVTLSMITELLQVIRESCGGDEADFQAPAMGQRKRSFPITGQQLPDSKQEPASKRHRLHWALRGKTKRLAQVEQFDSLVQALYSLVPLPSDGSKDFHLGRKDREAFDNDDDELIDEVSHRHALGAEIRQVLERVEREMEAETERALHTWLLGRFSPNELYDRSKQRRLEGTCEWVLQLPAFCEWSSTKFTSTSPKLLWINGPAGFGKTVLCARIIDFMMSIQGAPVAHYFFSSDFESRADPFLALRLWLSQLMRNRAAFAVAHERWVSQASATASRQDVIKVFGDVVKAVPGSTFIVDGLDECNSPDQDWKGDGSSVGDFLQTVRQMVANTETRLLVVSRDEPDIRAALISDESESFIEHRVSPADVQPDVMSYSRSLVAKKLPKKPSSLQEDISQKMAERCQGQFLWLKLQQNTLQSWKSSDHLKNSIEKEPTGLEHLYQRNWGRILALPDHERSEAIALLRWAAFAIRPLTVAELAEALLVHEDCESLLIDEVPESITTEYITERIQSPCGSLIEVRGGSSADSPIGSWTVHLTHFSVKQHFLQMVSVQGSLVGSERLQASCLAKTCLQYISFQISWQEPSQDDAGSVARSFRSYAASSWYRHIISGDSSDVGVSDLVKVFFDPCNPSWNSWCRWFEAYGEGSDTEQAVAAKPNSILYYASLLGLRATVEFLICERKIDTNEEGPAGETALIAACKKGDLQIVDFLLHSGADLAIANNEEETALLHASRMGHSDIAKSLLGLGANCSAASVTGWTPIHAASERGHAEVVQLLLQKGSYHSGITVNSQTPLYLASDGGHVDVVKLLLDKGGDHNIATLAGWTPLNTACDEGHADVVKLLLENGADCNQCNKRGTSPLLSASRRGHIGIVSMLLEQGADRSLANNFNQTALYMASNGGHLKIVQMLLREGADHSKASQSGWTPLNTACEEGHADVVRFLLREGADASISSNVGWAPIYSAATRGYTEIVRDLLDSGIDCNIKKKGWTPLSSACREGFVEIVRLLLDRGADLDDQNNEGWTPLNTACREGHFEVINLLVDKGADLFRPNDNGFTPLHTASLEGFVAIMKLLLDNGARSTISTTDKTGWTPLNSASWRGRADAVRLLLENGASSMIETKNAAGFTPLSLASHEGHTEVAEVLLEEGGEAIATTSNANGWTALNLSCYGGHVEVAKLLIAGGAQQTISTPRDNGSTPLISACQKGHVEIGRLLLENGARSSVGVRNDHGFTPLHYASREGSLELVKLLLENGTEQTATAVDELGWTPLHIAAHGRHTEVARLLIDKGALLDAKTKQKGRTSLHLAAENGHADMVELLLRKAPNLVNSLNVYDITPFHEAVSAGHFDAVVLLLKWKADVSIADDLGFTTLHTAARKGNCALLNVLLEQDGTLARRRTNDGRTALHIACDYGRVEVARRLLEHAATSHLVNTPLISPSDAGNDNTASQNLRDANVRHAADAKDDCGRTPLFFAAARGHMELVQVLLSHKVDYNALDCFGSTPLFAAVTNGCGDIVELLLALDGIALDLRDSLGRTVFERAKTSGNARILEVLHEKNGSQADDGDCIMSEYQPATLQDWSRWCDMCTRIIREGSKSYKCGNCASSELDCCYECFEAGALCPESVHGPAPHHWEETVLQEPGLDSDFEEDSSEDEEGEA